MLTVIDAYSRKVLTHVLHFNIKKGNVTILLSLILIVYKIENVTLKKDNISQLIATVARQFLKEKDVNLNFIHVGKLEEYDNIESLDSNV